MACILSRLQKIYPIAKEFDSHFTPTATSLSNAISDRVAKRKKQVIDVVTASNGGGAVVSDADIVSAQNELKKYAGIEVSPDGALALAGLFKLKRSGRFKYQAPVIVISGK